MRIFTKRLMGLSITFGILLTFLAAACGGDDATPVVVEKEVTKEVVREVPQEVIVEKEVIKEVVREVPQEVIVEKEVTKEVVVEKEVTVLVTPIPQEVYQAWVVPTEPEHDIREGVSLMFPIPHPIPLQIKSDGGIPLQPGEEPIPGGWIRIVTHETPHFDIAKITDGVMTFWFNWTSDRLFTHRYGAGISGNDFTPVPALGLDFRQVDSNTFLIPLRRGVKWEDKFPVNGREFVCADAKFSLERYLAPDATLGKRLGPISEVTCRNDYLLELRTSAPFANLMGALANPYFPMLAPEVLDEFGGFDTAETLLSIGPFILDEYTPGVRMVFKRNPNYWRQPLPFVDGIFATFSYDGEATTARFLAKEIDFDGVYAGQWAAYSNGLKRRTLVEDNQGVEQSNIHYSMIQNYLQMPTNIAPFDNVKVRQAISMAIDRKAIKDIAFVGDAIEANGVVSAASDWYLSTEELGAAGQYLEHNPERARGILAEAGYEDGFSTRLIFANYWSPAHTGAMEMLSTMLGEVGIDARVEMVGFVEYATLRDTGVPDGIVWSDRGAANDPGHTLRFYLPEDPLNGSQVDDPVLTDLIIEQEQELDLVKRKVLIDELQRYITETMYYIPINSPLVASIYQTYVKNYSQKEGYDRTNYNLIWFTEDAPGRDFTP